MTGKRKLPPLIKRLHGTVSLGQLRIFMRDLGLAPGAWQPPTTNVLRITLKLTEHYWPIVEITLEKGGVPHADRRYEVRYCRPDPEAATPSQRKAQA